jgi:hypothetical protein
MSVSLRLLVVGAYAAVWVAALYGGTAVPSVYGGPAVAATATLIIALHVTVGAALRSWWACALALVPPVVGAAGHDDWPLLLLYVPPATILIALGVGIAAARGRRSAQRGA